MRHHPDCECDLCTSERSAHNIAEMAQTLGYTLFMLCVVFVLIILFPRGALSVFDTITHTLASILGVY